MCDGGGEIEEVVESGWVSLTVGVEQERLLAARL